ncbi:CDP-alcohol phosphatidyltransferase family protein, partial [Carnobacterium sp.]|uniref:CDP-alcohol phosphatidyltransferase family protein n=1 Tax=Carnobacterium sp. TaxID=48221 RepID=UPI0028A8BCD4
LLTRYEWMWSIILLFVAKELFMGICNLVLLRRGTKLDGAKWYGKLSTAVFYICMFFLIAFPTIATSQAILLISITAFFLSLSFILYGKIFIQMYQTTKR